MGKMSKRPKEVVFVKESISLAFSGMPRPSRITKRVAIALDDEWILDDERGRELYESDPEQRWEDLTDHDIEEFCLILPWLDGEGIRFYLPAFMQYALHQFPSEGHRAISDIHDLAKHNPKLLRELTPDQFKAYLEFERLYGNEV